MLLFHLSVLSFFLATVVVARKGYSSWGRRDSCNYRKLLSCWNAMNLTDNSLHFQGALTVRSCKSFFYFLHCLGPDMEQSCANAQSPVAMSTSFMNNAHHRFKHFKQTVRANCELNQNPRTQACVEEAMQNEYKMASCWDSPNYKDDDRLTSYEGNVAINACMADVLGDACGPDVRAPYINLMVNLEAIVLRPSNRHGGRRKYYKG